MSSTQNNLTKQINKVTNNKVGALRKDLSSDIDNVTDRVNDLNERIMIFYKNLVF
jgi:flagellar hook-associated protein FlgK